MARLVAIGTAVPPYQMKQSEVKAFARQHFFDSFEDLDRLLTLFDHTGIEKRYFSKPREWFEQDHSFAEKNDAYLESAAQLGKEAIQKCLKLADVSIDEIDHLIFISTTGMATPSLDAVLIQRLGMNPHIKRTPIWGLGCAGGVVGLARAFEYAQASPRSRVLLVAVECCSLTFRWRDLSKSNLVATSLFADGAAAALVVGNEVYQEQFLTGPKMVKAMSTIFPHSLDIMGWQVRDDGLQVVFSKQIPMLVEQKIRPVVGTFLHSCHLDLADVDSYITHPGGMKVLQAYQKALELPDQVLQNSYQILRHYGNMSAVTVLFVLAVELEQSHQYGSYGLVSALGPGFSAEMLLLRWGASTAEKSETR